MILGYRWECQRFRLPHRATGVPMITTPATTGADRNVRTVADHIEITDLVHRLGLSLDEARFDDMAELLVADATVRTPGGRAAGRDAVIGQARRNHPADQRFQHV